MSPVENRIIIFAKAPVPGLVKTRLCPPLTYEEAAALYRTMARETFSLARLHSNARVEIAYEAKPEYPDPGWMDGGTAVSFSDQGEGDLGARLSRAFGRLFKSGLSKIVAIGCDCPDMNPQRFDEAFDALDRHDVVLGPAADGGYYLIGLNDPRPSLFHAIPWSTSEVFAATMKLIQAANLSAAVLPVEHDIDRPEDLESFVMTEIRTHG